MKKIVSLILCLAMLLTLCACSSKDEPKTHEVDMGGYTIEITSVDYTLSEYLSSGETIWYQLDEDKGKDSDVKKIFVINPDGTLYYIDKVTETLGELEQMEDADIVAMVKEEYHRKALVNMVGCDPSNEELVKEWVQSALFGYSMPLEVMYEGFRLNDLIEYGYYEGQPVLLTALEAEKEGVDSVFEAARGLWLDGEGVEVLDLLQDLHRDSLDEEQICEVLRDFFDYHPEIDCIIEQIHNVYSLLPDVVNDVSENILTQAEDISKNIQPVPYKLAITTDPSGNHTASMLFAYQLISTPAVTRFDGFNLYYQYPITTSEGITTNCTTVVYDSIYGGFSDDGDLFYTRINTNAHFMLDQVGENDLPVDVKDVKSLFI